MGYEVNNFNFVTITQEAIQTNVDECVKFCFLKDILLLDYLEKDKHIFENKCNKNWSKVKPGKYVDRRVQKNLLLT